MPFPRASRYRLRKHDAAPLAIAVLPGALVPFVLPYYFFGMARNTS